MSTWTLCESALPCKVYRRPLGTSELSFYWDGEFSGTADTLQHAVGELQDLEHRNLLSPENVTRAWIELKQRYPILAASVVLNDDGEGAKFYVDVNNLQQARPGEVNLEEVGTAADVEHFNEALVTGQRQLSAQQPARVWILLRRDSWRHFHVITHIAHMMVDGLSNARILREIFNLLCGPLEERYLSRVEERLALTQAIEQLHPYPKSTLARKRWRYAIASVIEAIQTEKMQGGHTLPRKVTPNTSYTPAHSQLELLAFPTDTSIRILMNCRKARITFGHALPVLSQIAQTRILNRLRRQNKISDGEWGYRLRQPMHFEGPRSLRSYLQPDWYSSGGFDGVGLFCANYTNTLPHMPMQSVADSTEPTSPFAGLMSRERFLHRSRIVKEEMNNGSKHPLLYEFSMLFHRRRIRVSRDAAQTWQALCELGPLADELSQTPPLAEYPGDGNLLFTNGGSSMGNLDLVFPGEYPLPTETDKNPRPILRATLSTNRLRCRPKELYLGAYMTNHQINLLIFWDENVYERSMVREWAEEVRLAAVHYLGQTVQVQDSFESLVSRL